MTAENKQIVFLAGYSAAGKSTLAREMRDNWGYTLVEHQPMVHGLATKKGYKRARHWLAEVGVDRFAEESAKEMISRAESALGEGKTKIVFDVAYGVKMLELFRNEFPDIFMLVVSVLSDEDTRMGNIQKRMGAKSIEEAKQELHFRDDFLRQVGVDEVLERSDIEVTNKGRPVGEVVTELIRLIERHLSIHR
jgi:dephospho-CoA kinase